MENAPRLRPHAVFGKFLKWPKGEVCRGRRDDASCFDCGVPQTLQRPALLASRPVDIGMIDRTHHGGPPAVRDAVGDLNPIRDGRASKDTPPGSRGLPAASLERISQIPRSIGRCVWDRQLVLPCRRDQSGRSYDHVYGHMPRDRPATATTLQVMPLGSGRLGRPSRTGRHPSGRRHRSRRSRVATDVHPENLALGLAQTQGVWEARRPPHSGPRSS